MTSLQAFNALRKFLENYYEQNSSDDICDVLTDTSMDIWKDGGTADPACWGEWIDAIKKVKNNLISDDDHVTLLEGFQAAKEFLKNYSQQTDSEDINNIVEDMESNSSMYQNTWNSWINAVQSSL